MCGVSDDILTGLTVVCRLFLQRHGSVCAIVFVVSGESMRPSLSPCYTCAAHSKCTQARQGITVAFLRDDLFRVCSGSDHAEAVLLAAFPAGHVPVVAAKACVVPFLLDPAAALSRMSPWHMKLRCLDLVAAVLLGVSTAVCTRHSPDASVLARFSLPAGSSVRAWLLRLRTVFDFAPAHLPAADPVLHMSAPVRRGAVADARLGLA